MDKEKADMIIYTTEDGLTKVETTFDGDTVWLSIDQMAELFQRDRSVIGKHVRNVFKEGELEKESVWAKFAYTASDGKVYNVDYYNLDVIISVGYRVKSKRGTQFRIWATGILKEYMRHVFSSFLTLKLRFPVGSLTDVREVSALVCGHGQLRQLLRQNALRYLDWIRQNYE